MLELSALNVQRGRPTRRLNGKVRIQPRPCTLEHAHGSRVLRVAHTHGVAPGGRIAALNYLVGNHGRITNSRIGLHRRKRAFLHVERVLIARECGAVMRLAHKPQPGEPLRVGGKRYVAQRRVIGGDYHANGPSRLTSPLYRARRGCVQKGPVPFCTQQGYSGRRSTQNHSGRRSL